MAGAAVRLLVGRVSSHSLKSILNYSLSWYMDEKQHLCSVAPQDICEMICEFLLHPHLWLRNISNRLVALCFTNITEADRETFLLMRPSRLFFIAATLFCQLRTQPTDDAARALFVHNVVFAICHLHSLLRQTGYMDFPKFWSHLEDIEQSSFVKASHVLDPRKGRGTLAYLTSNHGEPHGKENKKHSEYVLVCYLLKKMARISLQMEILQTKVVFNCFKLISPTHLLGELSRTTPDFEDDERDYAYQMLLPLHKVSEGYAGKVVADDVKQLAHEVCCCIRDNM